VLHRAVRNPETQNQVGVDPFYRGLLWEVAPDGAPGGAVLKGDPSSLYRRKLTKSTKLTFEYPREGPSVEKEKAFLGGKKGAGKKGKHKEPEKPAAGDPGAAGSAAYAATWLGRAHHPNSRVSAPPSGARLHNLLPS